MKITLTASLLIMWATMTLAQVKTVTTYLGSPTKRADHLYANEYYQEATQLYRRAIARHPEDARLKLQLAESYHRLNDPGQAVRWYREAIHTPQATTEHQLHYAQALLSTGRIRQAEEWYGRYYQINRDDQRAKQKLEGIGELPRFYEDSLLYSVQLAATNSPGADFAPAFYQDGIVFISSRQTKQPIQQVYRWNEAAYLSMFFAPLDKDNRTQGAVSFGESLGKDYHEGPVTFYDQDQQIIFTRNHAQAKKIRRLGLFTARQKGGRWTDVAPLPFNSQDYSVGHPTISEDGQTLYFISDMPGGIGGTDLYMSRFENGHWQEPKNLGRPINTEGDEMFPSLHSSGVLYFASTGHQGLGGLDIYKSSTTNPYVENLGYPVNSSYDDFSLILNEDETQGYYASNRGGATDDQLYQLTIHTQALDILVIDEVTRRPIADAEVTAVGTKALAFAMSDTVGEVHFSVNPYESYMLDVSREKYQGDAFILDAETLRSDTSGVVVVLKRETGTVEIMARLYDAETDKAIDRTLVHLVNVTTGDTISRIADAQGRVGVKVNPKYDYQFVGEIDGQHWDYPVIAGEALNVSSQNQISIPIEVPTTETPLLVTTLDDESSQPVEFTTVRLIAEGEEYSVLRTDQQGLANAKIDPGKNYLISVEPLAHYDDIMVITSEELSPGVGHPVEVLLNAAEDAISIEAQIYDSATDERLKNTIVRIVNEKTKQEKVALSDEQGTLRMKVAPGESYRVLGGGADQSIEEGTAFRIEAGKVPESFQMKLVMNEPMTYEDLVTEDKISLATADSAQNVVRNEEKPAIRLASSESDTVKTSEVRIMNVNSLRASPLTVIERSASEAPQVWVSINGQVYQLQLDDSGWYLQGAETRTHVQGSEGLASGWWEDDRTQDHIINNIYFDFDQYEITSSAGEELTKVSTFMQAHPKLKIEASTHTDTRGSKSYNRVLSQKRAQAMRAYLVDQGIDDERIYLRFYGEEQPLVSCSNGNCNETDHRKNRRGEILLNFID